MGDLKLCPQPSGLISDATLFSITISSSSSNEELWTLGELRISELISRIQPNKHSEERRSAVSNYVQRLILRCFDCQVFTFGSVPLKTYLPDGDIDLTLFSRHLYLRDTWANDVKSLLEDEERNQEAEFCVTDVQCIHAEVKLVKCLVENIVIDISFNQLGGLCTLCFLDEVDSLIGQDHLFKRSIILVKAWCYYESRLLGAHHGLISTYALETLVLYIFHVFHASLRGPLEVLFRFLDYFSNFDWDSYCLSLWGPIPLSKLPDMSAEPPRKDGGELLLGKDFLEACSDVYAVIPKSQINPAHTFVPKYLNVVDPLRADNNLGRSVSKASFHRIRSAFSFGARMLVKMFESPKSEFPKNLDNFFSSTWQRHHSGRRPDVPEPVSLPHDHVNLTGPSRVSMDREGTQRENTNTAKPFSSSPSKLDIENCIQASEALPILQIANKFSKFRACFEEGKKFEVGLNSSNLKLHLTSTETLSSSVTSGSFEFVSDVSKQCSGSRSERVEPNEERSTQLSLTSQSMDKGSSMASSESRLQMRKSTSVSLLGDSAAANHFSGDKLAGVTKGLTTGELPYLNPVNKEIGSQKAGQSFREDLKVEDSENKLAADSCCITSPSILDHSTGTPSRTNVQTAGGNFKCQSVLKDESTLSEPAFSNPCISSFPQKYQNISGSNEHLSESCLKTEDCRNKSALQVQDASVKYGLIDQDLNSKLALKQQEPVSTCGLVLSIQPVVPHHYGQVSIPFPDASQNPFQMPAPWTSAMPHEPAALTSGMHLQITNPLETFSSASLYTSLDSGPCPLPLAPLSPPSLPYPGFPYLTLASSMSEGNHNQASMFKPHGEEKEYHTKKQSKQQEQPTVFPQGNKKVQPWQLAAPRGFETDPFVERVPVGKKPAVKGSKFGRDRRNLKQATPMFLDTKETQIQNLTATKIAEGASSRVIEGRDDKPVPQALSKSRSSHSPMAVPDTVGKKNLPSAASQIISGIPSSDIESPPGAVQLPYITDSSLVMCPIPNQLVSVIPPVLSDSAHGVHPPLTEMSSMVLNSLQESFTLMENQSAVRAPCMYVAAGQSFPPFSLYDTVSAVCPSLENKLHLSHLSAPTPAIREEDVMNHVLDDNNRHHLRTSLPIGLNPGERPKGDGFPINSNVSPKEDLSFESFQDTQTEPTTDLLHSDFGSHLRNLTFGRYCQDPSLHTVMLSPLMMQFHNHLHSYHTWEGPGRPVHGVGSLNGFLPGGPLVKGFPHINMNLLNAFPGPYSVSYEDFPRPRGGTGTYLPMRHSTNSGKQTVLARNNQEMYSHEQDHNRIAGHNLKHRGLGHQLSHEGRSHIHKTFNSGAERYFGETRNGQENPGRKYSQGPGALVNSTVESASGIVPQPLYGSFLGAAMQESQVLPTLSTAKSYPYATASPALEFGSFGPSQLGEMMSNQGPSILNNVRPNTSNTSSFRGGDRGLQEVSSAMVQQRINQRTYQHREEDFPPLSFHGQQGGSSAPADGSRKGRSRGRNQGHILLSK